MRERERESAGAEADEMIDRLFRGLEFDFSFRGQEDTYRTAFFVSAFLLAFFPFFFFRILYFFFPRKNRHRIFRLSAEPDSLVS